MATRYWVGGSGTWDASTTTNWSSLSGGSGGASAPTSADDVIFNSASNVGTGAFTVTISTGAVCRNITASGLDGTMTLAGTAAWTIYGSLAIPATNFTRTYTGAITFAGTTSYTINTNGISLASAITFNGTGGTWTLQAALTTTGAVTLTGGTLALSTYTFTAGTFTGSGSTTRTLSFGTGKFVITSGTTGTIWDTSTVTNMTVSGTPVVDTTGAGGTLTVNTAGALPEANAISFNIKNTTGTVSLASGSYFKNLTIDNNSITVSNIGVTVNIYGDYTVSGTNVRLNPGAGGELAFIGTNVTQKLALNGEPYAGLVTLNGSGSTFQIQGDLSVATAATNSTTLSQGTLDLNGFKLTTNRFSSTGTGTRSISFGTTGSIEATGSSTIFDMAVATNFSYTGTFKFSSTYASTALRTINLGGTTAGYWNSATALNLSADTSGQISIGTSSAGAVSISGHYNNVTTTGYTNRINLGGSTLYGDLTLDSGGLATATTGTLTLAPPTGTTSNITTYGIGISDSVTINGAGTVQLETNFNVGISTIGAATLTLTAGTLILQSYTVTIYGVFNSNNSNSRTLDFGTGKIVLTTDTATAIWQTATVTGLTVSGTPLVETTGGGAVTKTISAGALSETNSISFSLKNTAGTVTFSANNTVRDLTINGAFTLANVLITIYGNYTYTAATALTAGTSAWTFAATSSKTITSGGATHDFPFTFNGVGGTWTLQDALTLGATRTATLTNGTLALGSYTLTTGLFASSNSNIRVLNFGTGKIVLTATTASTIWNTGTITGLTISGTPLVETTGAGATTKTINSGALSEANSISFSLLNSAGTVTFTASNSVNNLIINGALTLSNIAITIYGNYTYTTATALTAGANAWTFAATSSKTITSGGATYDFPFTFNGVGGTWTLQDALTIGATRTATLTNGTLALGSYTMTTGLFASSNSNIRVLNFGTGKLVLSGSAVTIWDTGTVTNFSWTGTAKVQSTATAAAITVTFGSLSESLALDVSTSNTDQFYFDTTVTTLTLSGSVNKLNLSSFNNTLANSTRTIYGDLTLSSSGTYTAGANITTFGKTSGTQNITTAGKTLDFPITKSGAGTLQLQDALTVGTTTSRTVTLSAGTISLGSYTVTIYGIFSSSNSTTRSINFGTGKIVLTLDTASTIWDTGTVTNLTVSGTPLVETTGGGATTKTINSGALSEATSISFSLLNTAGTVTFTASNTVKNLIVNGTFTLSNIAITIYGNYTYTTATALTAGANAWTFAATSSKTITSGGATHDFPFTFNGVGGTWTLQDALTIGATRTLTLTNGTLALSSYTLTTGLVASSNSNTRVLSFGTGKIVLTATTASTIWNTGTTTNLTVSGNPLVETTGGGAVTKTINSGALSEANSISFSLLNTAGTVTFTASNTVKNLIVNGTFTLSNIAITIYGNYTYTTATALTAGANAWTFAATSSKTITSGGATHDFPFTFNGVGGTWTLQDALTIGATRTLTLTNGVFNANNFSVTTGLFSSNNSNTRTLTMGSGSWTLTGTGTIWDIASGMTLNKDTANIAITDTSASTRTFKGGGYSYNTLTIGGTTGSSITIIKDSNSFDLIESTKTVAHNVYFESSTTQTVGDWDINGTSGNVVTLDNSWTTNNSKQLVSGSNYIYNLNYTGSEYFFATNDQKFYTGTDGYTWSLKSTVPTTETLLGSAYGNSVYVVVGTNGTIFTSSDSITWTSRTSGTIENLYQIAYVNGQFIVTGTNGTILTSTTGISWTSQTSGTSNYLWGINWNGSQYVVVGGVGTILTSSDGITWTSRTSGTSNDLVGIIWDGSQYVVVGYVGTILTSAAGVSWTSQTSGVSGILYDVAYNGSTYVIVGDAQVILTSANSTTWTNRTSTRDTLYLLGKIIWDGSKFVVTVQNNYIITSPNGSVWRNSNFNFYDIIYDGSQYLTVGTIGWTMTSSTGTSWDLVDTKTSSSLISTVYNGTKYITVGNQVISSTDGINWNYVGGGTVYDACWAGSKYWAVGVNGMLLTSTDGITWTNKSLGVWNSIGNPGGIYYTGSAYIIVGGSSTILYSTDGDNWTLRPVSTFFAAMRSVAQNGSTLITVGDSSVYFTSNDGGLTWAPDTFNDSISAYDIIYANSLYVVVGAAGATTILTSTDGITWTSRRTGTALYSVCWNGSIFVSVGITGTIATSTDGITWTNQTSGTANNLNSVVWDGSQFVAVGNSGTILTSSNGTSWTSQTSGVTSTLNTVVSNGTQLVAMGDLGTVLTSSNGTSWTDRTVVAASTLRSIIWDGSQFVTVGSSGKILTSSTGTTWTVQTSGTTVILYDILWDGNKYVTVGASGTILTSTNSTAWTSQTSGTSSTLQSVAANSSIYVAVGNGGTILTSTDAVTWAASTSNTSYDLIDIQWDGKQFIISGQYGTILSSTDGVTWASEGTYDVNATYLRSIVYADARYITVGDNSTILVNDNDPFTLDKSTAGTVSTNYLNISNSTATPSNTWYALTSNGNTNGGGNTGWIFSLVQNIRSALLLFFN